MCVCLFKLRLRSSERLCAYMDNTHHNMCTTGPMPASVAVVLKSPSFHIGWEILFQQVAASTRILATAPTNPVNPTQSPTLTPCSMIHHAVYKSNPTKDKSTSCLFLHYSFECYPHGSQLITYWYWFFKKCFPQINWLYEDLAIYSSKAVF